MTKPAAALGSHPAESRQMSDDSDLADASILLVDDNVQNLELMQAYLESLPCRLRTAHDGVEAFEAINEDAPDLALMARIIDFCVAPASLTSPSNETRMSGYRNCNSGRNSR